MDEYVYYWDNKDVYCYHEELVDFIDMYGNEYDCWLSKDFFETIGEGCLS